MQLYFNEKIERINQQLDAIFQEQDVPWKALHTASRYALFSGGKRLRPLITLTVTEALGGNLQAALIPACAIEIIHTYSLIHDDLPAMDNDDLRRGKPSLHKAMGEALAILTGDHLLTLAFDLISSAPNLDCKKSLTLIQILAKMGGESGMIGGQVIDIDQYAHPTTLVHELKTAALISAAAEFGSIIASEKQREKMKAFGKYIGLAYQMVDDILDGEIKIERSEAKTQAEKYLIQAIDQLEGVKEKKHLIELSNMLVYRDN